LILLPIRLVTNELKNLEGIIMSVSGIGSASVVAAYTSPVQQQQPAKAPQQTPKTDTVTISKQAQQLANDGDTKAQEVKEGGAEAASEKLRGKA
jgi:hypothetical protein